MTAELVTFKPLVVWVHSWLASVIKGQVYCTQTMMMLLKLFSSTYFYFK
jgi:hypothetical protein